MRVLAISLLILFTSFIAAPTVLTSLCKDIDVSMAYAFSEEEEETHKNPIEVITEFIAEGVQFSTLNFKSDLGKITNEFLSKHDNASSEIFSPPPEQKLV